MKKELIIILLLLILSIPASIDLFKPGAYTSHDLTHHIIRQIAMDKMLQEGQFPPRWSGDLNYGHGYPVFLFNYPLPPLLGEIFLKLGLNYIYAVKALFIVSIFASVLTMYLFLKELFGKDAYLASFLGAMFYLYAPWRFITIYVSASPGGALAFIFIPLIFWAITSLSKIYSLKVILIGSLSFASLILSHNVTAMLFAPIILAFSLIMYLQNGKFNKKSYFISLLTMFLLGLGLSAFFWLPALVESQNGRYTLVLYRLYADHFPTFWQLIRSPWGYGLSNKGSEDGMSFQIGLTQILVILILPFILWARRKSKSLLLGIFLIFTFVLSVVMMLEITLPIWDAIPLLQLVQYPFRFLGLAIFASSIGAALIIYLLPDLFKKTFFVLLLIPVIYANRNHWHINEVYDPGIDYYLNHMTTTTVAGEHFPIWGRMMSQPSTDGKFSFWLGQGKVTILEDKSIRVRAEIEATQESKLRFNQVYFPGWEITIDGIDPKFNYLRQAENNGFPLFDFPAGKHLVIAEFKNTPIRNFADKISLISWIIFVLLLCGVLTRGVIKYPKLKKLLGIG